MRKQNQIEEVIKILTHSRRIDFIQLYHYKNNMSHYRIITRRLKLSTPEKEQLKIDKFLSNQVNKK